MSGVQSTRTNDACNVTDSLPSRADSVIRFMLRNQALEQDADWTNELWIYSDTLWKVNTT